MYSEKIGWWDRQLTRDHVHVLYEMIVGEDLGPVIIKECYAFIERVQVAEKFLLLVCQVILGIQHSFIDIDYLLSDNTQFILRKFWIKIDFFILPEF